MVTQRRGAIGAGGRGAAAPGARAPRGVLRTPAEAARIREARRTRRHRRRLTVVWVLVTIVAGVAAFTGGLLSAPVDFTAPAPPKSALILDESGRVIAAVRSPEERAEVPAEDIPRVMRDAIVAAEDRTFFEHRGVDPLAIVRAAVKDVSGSDIQGGSTITQQYVKNIYTGQERTVLRKVREAALAVRLEHRLSKEEILTRYLNTTYFGNGTYGVQAASKYYYGVPIKDLDLEKKSGERSESLALGRAAMLAGLVPAPSFWNPVHDMPEARAHQLDVLNRMVQDAKITTQQASDAYSDPPRIAKKTRPETPTIAPEFRDYVRARLDSTFTPDELFRGGLRVRTTLDLDLQKAVVEAVKETLPNRSDPEAAVVAIDPRNGDIKAMTTRVATAKRHSYESGGFNLATQATRSSGSTIKPFTLAAALMHGHSISEVRYGPACANIPNPGGTPNPYRPCNAGDGESGSFSLSEALVHSVNTIYAPLAADVGLRKVMNVAGAAGLAPRKNLRTNLANALGVDVTPISMASAYSTLVNHGLRHEPRSILTVRSGGAGGPDAGDIVYRAPAPESGRAMPAGIADQVTQAMAGVVDHGTGTAARQDFTVYGKTGTTNENRDAWFVGCTRKLCIATWMGYDKLRPMVNVQGVSQVYGGTLPAKIFASAWGNYERIKEEAKHPGKVSAPSPSPRPVVRTPERVRPTHTPKPKPTASHSRKPTPKPTPTSSPTPKLTPTPKVTPPIPTQPP